MTEEEVFGEYLNKSNNTKSSKRKKYATIERHVHKDNNYLIPVTPLCLNIDKYCSHRQREIDIRSLEKDLHIKDISVPAHLPTR